MTKVFVQDSQGNKTPASWFLPPQALEVMDTGSTRLLLSEVTKLEAQFAEYQFAGTTFRELFAVEPIEDGVDYVGYKQKLVSGKAEFISRNATSFPTVSTGMKPYMKPVIPIGIAYTINFFEERSLKRWGMSAEQDGPEDCAQYIDQKLDEGAHAGGQDPDGLEIEGVFDWMNGGGSHATGGTSFYEVTLGTGVSGNTWALKTGAEIYADIAAGIMSVFTNSKKNCVCKVVAMGFTAYYEFSRKLITDSSGATVKLEPVVRAAFPNVKFVIDPYLDAITHTKGAGGGANNETWNGSAGSGAVLFLDNDRRNMIFRANDREILRPYEYSGFNTKVNTFGLTAGLQVKRTYAGSYMKGVS